MSVFLDHYSLLVFETHSLNLKLTDSAVLLCTQYQGPASSCFAHTPRLVVKGIFSYIRVFTYLLRIKTQVLQFAWEEFYTVNHLPSFWVAYSCKQNTQEYLKKKTNFGSDFSFYSYKLGVAGGKLCLSCLSESCCRFALLFSGTILLCTLIPNALLFSSLAWTFFSLIWFCPSQGHSTVASCPSSNMQFLGWIFNSQRRYTEQVYLA